MGVETASTFGDPRDLHALVALGNVPIDSVQRPAPGSVHFLVGQVLQCK